jgi:hypothetical protein
MKKIKILSVLFMVITLTSFTFISCEEEAASAICNTDTAYNNYLEAINSFSSNPTKSNCNNLKSKANAFIDAAESCGGIDASSAHNTINSIDCSDF